MIAIDPIGARACGVGCVACWTNGYITVIDAVAGIVIITQHTTIPYTYT